MATSIREYCTSEPRLGSQTKQYWHSQWYLNAHQLASQRGETYVMAAEITVCEPDFRVRIDAANVTPNDPLYKDQWNFPAIKVPTAWAAGQMGDPQRRVITILSLFDCAQRICCDSDMQLCAIACNAFTSHTPCLSASATVLPFSSVAVSTSGMLGMSAAIIPCSYCSQLNLR